jgi:hypothetical protein
MAKPEARIPNAIIPELSVSEPVTGSDVTSGILKVGSVIAKIVVVVSTTATGTVVMGAWVVVGVSVVVVAEVSVVVVGATVVVVVLVVVVVVVGATVVVVVVVGATVVVVVGDSVVVVGATGAFGLLGITAPKGCPFLTVLPGWLSTRRTGDKEVSSKLKTAKPNK